MVFFRSFNEFLQDFTFLHNVIHDSRVGNGGV